MLRKGIEIPAQVAPNMGSSVLRGAPLTKQRYLESPAEGSEPQVDLNPDWAKMMGLIFPGILTSVTYLEGAQP